MDNSYSVYLSLSATDRRLRMSKIARFVYDNAVSHGLIIDIHGIDVIEEYLDRGELSDLVHRLRPEFDFITHSKMIFLYSIFDLLEACDSIRGDGKYSKEACFVLMITKTASVMSKFGYSIHEARHICATLLSTP